jgi:KDO2-lipid IV(A) lauroyltransferase
MILYYLYRSVAFLLNLLPFAARKAFFVALASLARFLDRSHRAVVRRNLGLAFGETLDKAEAETIERYCYRNLLLNFLQVMENRRTGPEALHNLFHFENLEVVEAARREGRPIIFVSGHFGNWELGAAAISSLFASTVTIHKPLSNAYFNRYLLEARTRMRMRMVEKKGALKHLARTLSKGETVMLMIDQNLNPRESLTVDFFGIPTTQTPAPASLARKFNAAIIPAFVHTEDEKHYTVRFEAEIPVAHTDDAEADIQAATQAQADVMQRIVEEEPKFWFWCHRRWKGGNRGIYDVKA